ncbi:hypothetical protein DSUL_50359 [Desulfovibrionales bacterium]
MPIMFLIEDINRNSLAILQTINNNQVAIKNYVATDNILTFQSQTAAA